MKKIALALILALAAVVALFTSLSAMATRDAGTSGVIIREPWAIASDSKAEPLMRPPAASAASITLDPISGTPGTVVHVTGSGFRPNKHFSVQWDGTGPPLASGKTDAKGGLSAWFSVPSDATPGEHTVEVREGPNRASAVFEVTSPEPPDEPTVTPEPPGRRKLRFEGYIESIPEDFFGEWVIGGITVTVDANTKINESKGKAEVGAWAEVKATQQPYGYLLATHIWIKAARGQGVEPIKFKGEIEAFTDTVPADWVISGITVTVDARTVIRGMPEVGAWAEVKAFLQADGSILAKKIDIKPREEEEATVEFEGPIESLPEEGYLGDWVIDGITVTVNITTTIEGIPQVGLTAEVKAVIQADNTVLALKIKVAKEVEGEEVEFEGFISAIITDTVDLWVIGGITVTVDTTTFIDESKGRAEVGAWVEVKAIRQPDGSLLAIRIRVERRSEEGGLSREAIEHRRGHRYR